MSVLRVGEAVLVLIAIIGASASLFWFMEARHAQQIDLLRIELEAREGRLDTDIKNKAVARVYYKDISRSRELEAAEQSRLEYLERTLDRQYEEQTRVQDRLDDLNERK